MPHVVILAGPNGAGKTTAAPSLLRGGLRVSLFVNADTIAQGLAAFDPADAALHAGQIMLDRIHELTARRVDFAFETTLSGRTLAAWLRQVAAPAGYASHLVFLWLPSADMAVARVKDRVRMGGHDVPDATVRRRYKLGIANLFSLYQPLLTTWRPYNNENRQGPGLIATGGAGVPSHVRRQSDWARLLEQSRRD